MCLLAKTKQFAHPESKYSSAHIAQKQTYVHRKKTGNKNYSASSK